MSNYGLGVAQGAIVITYDGAGVAKAEASVAGLESTTKKSAGGIAAASKKMATAGAIIAGGLAVAAHEAADFQSQMNLLVTAAGESPKAIGMVSKGIQDIAIQTGTSLDQLSEGMYTVEKAGMRGGKGLNVLKAAAEGAKAENVDLGTFTNALTSVMTSYSYKASDAVGVTNMLVRAAGASKTTMQEFAASLANVLPVASALGISFADVAGAESVLTQHGTSAQESTHELANLIQNLAGQNNVAKNSLEQLGVNVVDLQKNFGKRGLAGTLDVVTGALLKHGQAGMIVTSALKQSQTAEAALGTMLGKLNPGIRTQAKGLLDGSVSIKDFTASAKGLGGHQGAMATQFKGLYLSSQGFSNALKSGNPQVATLAATLQKALGGVTGMRTALQLGVTTNKEASTSQKLLKDNTKAIGDEFHKNGKDIDTWGKTSKTASVQFGQLKSTMQVVAVLIGNVVLPAFVKIANAVRSVLMFLVNLSPGARRVITIIALLGASMLLASYFIMKLVKAGKLVVDAAKAMWTAFESIGRGITALMTKLGILGTAEAESAAVSTAAAEERVAAADAVQVAWDEAEANIAAAQAGIEAAERDAAVASAGSAAQQEEAAAGVAAAHENMARVIAEADASITAAESEMSASATASLLDLDVALGATGTAASTAAAEIETSLSGIGAVAAEQAVVVEGAMTAITEAEVAAGEASTVALGPVGVAIAGIVGVIGLATDGFGLFGDGAKAAIKPTDDFTSAISRDNDALGHNTSLLVANKLEKDGLYDAGLKLGISQRTLTQAAMGNTAAIAAVNLAMAGADSAAFSARNAHRNLTQAESDGIDAASKLSDGLAVLKTTLDVNQRAAKNISLGLGEQKDKTDAATASTQGSTAAHNAQIAALDRQAAAQGGLSGAIGNTQAKLDRYAASHANPKINADASKARGSISSLQAEMDAIRQNKVPGIKANTAEGKLALQIIQGEIDALRQNKTPAINANTSQARAGLEGLLNLYNSLQDKTINVGVVTSGTANTASHSGIHVGGLARGGWTPGHPALKVVHPNEYMLSADMLAGRSRVDPAVLATLSDGQMAALAGGSRTPVSRVSGGAGHAAQPVTVAVSPSLRVGGGELTLDADSQGNLRAWVQDLILSEHDYQGSLAGMR